MRLSSGIFACLLAASASPAPRRVVAVMYFDNNTDHQEFEPLRKGLADMMITDLAAAPGLTLVEREKLQKLVGEIDLQKTRFFDPATSLKMGKGVGATHAITGSIEAVDPEVRINIRLLDVGTGTVVVTAHVKGNRDQFFELEEQLVKKFLGALEEADSGRKLSGVQTVASLVAYGQALDAADRGDLKTASSQLSKVVSASPSFSLAKERYQQILKQLYGAAEKREDLISAAAEQLGKNADAFLEGKQIAQLKGHDPAYYFGYRILKGSLVMRQLEALLKTENPSASIWNAAAMSPAVRARALPLMRAWYANAEVLLDEVGRWKAGAGQRAGYVPTHLPEEDRQRLKSLGGSADDAIACFGCPEQLPIDIAKWAVLGFANRTQTRVAPALAVLEPAFAQKALALLDAHLAQLEERKIENFIAQGLFAKAECLLALRRQDEAIAAWQQLLDRFPTHHLYPGTEERIKETLGLSKAQLALEAAIASCSGVSSAFSNAASEIERVAGIAALGQKLSALDAVCGPKGQLGKNEGGSAYLQAANRAGAAGECELFKQWRDKALERLPQLPPSAAIGGVCASR